MIASGRVRQIAAELGFALCGVTEALPADHRQEVIDWLAAGKHGEMHYLAENLELRLDPAKLLPGARAVISVADDIGHKDDADPAASAGGYHQGRIARYAQFNDYHTVIKKRLHELTDVLRTLAPSHEFRACVDTAPTLEREHARRAGLGWTGKHTLLIHPTLGSHLLLGQIITTLPLAPDPAEHLPDTFHGCGSCTRCIDACPTHCITPNSVDASRCISYLTIEHRGTIDPALHESIGDWIFGCDVCQDVCPFNTPGRAEHRTTHTAYGPPRTSTLNTLDVLNWTEDDRRIAFTRSAMKRAKLDAMKRNALIVAGNHLRREHPSARPASAGRVSSPLQTRIEQLASDPAESDLVRVTAQQILTALIASI